MRQRWLKLTWRVKRAWGRVQCLAGRHRWEERLGVALDEKAAGKEIRPGRFRRCQRRDCRIVQGTPALHDFGRYIEVDDFLVVAKKSCQKCSGRGYDGRMVLQDGFSVKVPCKCLTVQPAFFERKVEKRAGKDAAKSAVSGAVVEAKAS